MRRKHVEGETRCRQCMFFLGVMLFTTAVTCFVLSPVFQGFQTDGSKPYASLRTRKKHSGCCDGVDHLEYWGRAVKWGASHYVNSSFHCCDACKRMCPETGPCECNSWVFCGDKEMCGDKLGQCWLKKQEDPLNPDVNQAGDRVMWTSGLVFPKGVGVVALKTIYGVIRLQLLPNCAPRSTNFFLEVLRLRHCAGCQIYRAEPRGFIWDAEGKLLNQAKIGPPYGLLQGIIDTQAMTFEKIPSEHCAVVKRGMVGWISGGPDFFISLADHPEWPAKHSVFGHVVAEDMEMVETLAALPTHKSDWSGVRVAVLKTAVTFSISRSDVSGSAEVLTS